MLSVKKFTHNLKRYLKCNIVVIYACITIVIYVVYTTQFLTNESTRFNKLRVIETNLSTKYVLIWTTKKKPLVKLGRGNGRFHNRNCSYKNCFVTLDKSFFKNMSEFDAIIFHGPEVAIEPQDYLPKDRSPKQSYIFASLESSTNHLFDSQYNGIFNFTWTYKLKSDIKFEYIAVRDHNGKAIGPAETVPWIGLNDMLPINDTIKSKLADKSIAAAWFASNCHSRNERERLAYAITSKLQRFHLVVDVYGKCGFKECPRYDMSECLKKLQKDYYFYFAFENSFSDDYVTEKLLYALQNYAVPVVYGGANYRRFMPDGIYLNAAEVDTDELVRNMVTIIRNKEKYHEFFKWHNHYSYHDPEEAPDTDPYCSFCAFMNKINYSKISTVENFDEWWNEDTQYKTSLADYRTMVSLKSWQNDSRS